MKRNVRRLGWSLLGLCLVAFGCGEAPEESVPATPKGRPDRVVQDFVLLETDEGRPDWKLTSDTAEYFKTPSETHLKGVYLEFYEPDGSVRSWLTSDQGTVSEGSGDMTAVGNVVLVSAGGDTLRTEELYFARVQELITGPGFVRITKPDRVLTGIGFRAKPDLSEYEVEQDVHLTLIDRSGGQVIDQ